MSSPKQPAVTQQISKVELPAWVDAASQANVAEANQIAAQPYQAYTGERVAGLTAMEQAAGGTLNSGIARSNTALDAATGIAANTGGFAPRQVRAPGAVGDVEAQGFLSRNVGAYMDPELNNVINPTMDRMRREISMGTQAIGDEARGVGAWGGSRHGVREAVYGAEGARNMAATEAGMRSQAYNNATGLITQDNASALQAALANQNKSLNVNQQGLAAQTANQNADIAGAGLRLQAGSLANQTAQTAADTAGRSSILQQQLGQNERSVAQAQLDQQHAAFQEQRDAPTEALNLRLAALGMSPYGKTTSGTTTQPNNNSGNTAMAVMGGAATLLPLMFSDRKTKKNVRRIGKVPGTDLNQYEFQYKKGFMGRDLPKQVGLMADDVKKKVPGAVIPTKVKGKKVDMVDYDMALADAPRDSRNDKGHVRGIYKPRGIGIGGRTRRAA